MQKTDWKSDICALRKWEFLAGRQFGRFPRDGKFPNLGNFQGIPVWEIPGREKFEAIRAGGNGNFLLNIPDAAWKCIALVAMVHC